MALIFVLFFLLGVLINIRVAEAQTGTANAIASYNVPITGVTVVIAHSLNNISWMFHPENGNVRCTWGNLSGSAPTAPTTSSGTEFLSGGYYNSGIYTPASVEMDCIPEAGGTVNSSGTIESR